MRKIEDLLFLLLFFLIFIPHITVEIEETISFYIPQIFTFSILYFLFSVVLSIYLFKTKKFQALTFKSSIYAFILIFLFLVSTLLSRNPKISFFGSLEREFGFLILVEIIGLTILIPAVLDTREKIIKFLKMSIWFSLFYSIFGILQFLKLDPLGYGRFVGDRSISFFGNANYFGPIALIFFFLSLGYFLYSKKWIFFVISLINLLSLFTSQTMASVLSLFIGIIVFYFLLFRFFKEKKKLFIKSIMIILVLFVLILSLSVFLIKPDLKDLILRLETLTTLKTRMLLVRDSLRMIKNEFRFKDYLFGFGPENFQRPFLFYKSIKLEKLEPKRIFDNPHNFYLDVFIKYGILSLLLIFIIICSLFKSGFNKVKREKDFLIFLLILPLIPYLFNLIFITQYFSMFLFFALLFSLGFSILREEMEIKLNLTPKFMIILILIISFVSFIYFMDVRISDKFAFFGFKSMNLYESSNSEGKFFESERKLKIAIRLNPFEDYYKYLISKLYLIRGEKTKNKEYFKKSIIYAFSIKETFNRPDLIYEIISKDIENLKYFPLAP